MGHMIELTSVFLLRPKQWPVILYPRNESSLFFDEMMFYYQDLLHYIDPQILSDLLSEETIDRPYNLHQISNP